MFDGNVIEAKYVYCNVYCMNMRDNYHNVLLVVVARRSFELTRSSSSRTTHPPEEVKLIAQIRFLDKRRSVMKVLNFLNVESLRLQ
jgi:hypothetical protein